MPQEYKLADLRSIDDFLLGSARFQIPNIKDLEKWNNRVASNLLYYQTNYFLMSVVIFVIVGVLHPVKFVCGMIALGIAFLLFYYSTNATRSAERFKKEHPLVGIGLVLIGGYFIVYLMGGVLVFLFGTFLPILVTFIHASMRTRNIKNKLANKLEQIEIIKTPMGLILDTFDLWIEAVHEDIQHGKVKKFHEDIQLKETELRKTRGKNINFL